MDSQTDLFATSLTNTSAVTEVLLGSSNDAIFTSTEHAAKTVYKGGLGTDRINLVLTSEQLQMLINAGQLAELKRYISSPTDQILNLSVLNFSAEEFEVAALYIQAGDRLISISTDALLKTEDTLVGVLVIEAPPVETPPVETPPVEAPSVETPPVETPPAEVPPIETPPVETPPVETPPAEVPSVETPPVETPLVELPPAEATLLEALPGETLPVGTLPVELPPIESTPGETPTVEIPLVETLPVEVPPVAESHSLIAGEEQRTLALGGEAVLGETLPSEVPPLETPVAEAAPVETVQPAGAIAEATPSEGTGAIATALIIAPQDPTPESPTLVGQPNVNTLFIAMDTAYVIKASSGSDFIYTGDSDDLIYTSTIGSIDIDQVWGGAGNDTIVLSGGADTIYGEEGDDLFLFNVPDYADSGALDGDTIYGGSGIDTIRNDTAGADIFLWQINNFYQFNTSTWISGVEVFDGNGGVVIGDAIRTNYLAFSAFDKVINVPSVRTGNNYDLVDASTFTAGVEVYTLAGNDVIIGSAGDDTLVGGVGNDTLTGGAGSDIFQLDAPGLGVDYITSFTPGVDKLRIVASEFGNFQGAGVLEASGFALGVAARTPNHRIIYNPLNGDLLYDANGAGDGIAPVQIAILPLNLSLTRADIVVVS